MSNIEVKHLLRYKRFTENEWKFVVLLCYLPIGIVLFILRSILALSVFLLGYVLPDVPVSRKIINKITCLSLGISVTVEDIKKKEHVDVYVGNSISLFDNLAVHLVTAAVSNGPKLHPLIGKSLGIFNLGNPSDVVNFTRNVHSVQSLEKCPLYFSPEGKVTNGRALIKFQTYPFSIATKVQPICISVERPFLDVSLTSLGSSSLADIFFYMFSPLTNYKLKFLAALEKKDLSDDAFADIVRENLAAALRIEAVDLTAQDLIEWEKRQLAEQKRIRSEQTVTNPAHIPAVRRMAMQVKEVLPHVPSDVIYKDLYRTRNVDNTITNILEGRIHFVPEILTSPSSSSSSASSSNGNLQSSKSSSSSSSSVSVGASSFPKSAQERSRSFQERKEQLIAQARKRYIEKHNLDIPL